MAVLRVSIVFTIGCFVLVANSALSFLPFIGFRTDLPQSIIYVEGALSVVSCGLFLIGSVIAFWESYKATKGEGGYFGWELEDYAPVETQEPSESRAEKGEDGGDKAEEALLFPPAHYPHWNSTHAELFKHCRDLNFEDETASNGPSKPSTRASSRTPTRQSSRAPSREPSRVRQDRSSRPSSRAPSKARASDLSTPYPIVPLSESLMPPSWPQSPPPSYNDSRPPSYTEEYVVVGVAERPSWKQAFSAHGFHDMYCNLGLIASGIFLFSSFIYCATALASLITILSMGEVFRPIRYPQLVAGLGFIFGSLLLLIKTQKETTGHWWKPAPRRLAWHVNLWNLIGSAGFVFCALFGLYAPVHWSDFQFNCSYLWGSWAFLLGSMIQWYKARHKMKFVKRLDAKRAAFQLEKQLATRRKT